MIAFAKGQHSIYPNWVGSGNMGGDYCCIKIRGKREREGCEKEEQRASAGLQGNTMSSPKCKVTSPSAQHCCHTGMVISSDTVWGLDLHPTHENILSPASLAHR